MGEKLEKFENEKKHLSEFQQLEFKRKGSMMTDMDDH